MSRRPLPCAAVVRQWLEALAAGDRAAACRLFSALPACSDRGALAVRRFTIQPAELSVDGVDVPVTTDDQYALVSLQLLRGRYHIVDVVTDPGGAMMAPPGPAAEDLLA